MSRMSEMHYDAMNTPPFSDMYGYSHEERIDNADPQPAGGTPVNRPIYANVQTNAPGSPEHRSDLFDALFSYNDNQESSDIAIESTQTRSNAPMFDTISTMTREQLEDYARHLERQHVTEHFAVFYWEANYNRLKNTNIITRFFARRRLVHYSAS